MEMGSKKDYDFLVFAGEESGESEVLRCVERGLEGKERWAVVKVKSVEVEVVGKGEDDSRKKPVLEVSSKDSTEITELVKKSKVVINLLEPDQEGEIVLEACARNGVHCVTPISQTTPLSKTIEKYHNIAKESGAIIIIGLSSSTAPQDILSLISVTELRKKLQLSTREVLYSQPKNTLPSLLLKPEKTQHNVDQWILSPVLGQERGDGTNLFGIRKDSTLGRLEGSKRGCAKAIVYRSWGLLDCGRGTVYGARFCFNEFVESNSSTGVLRRKILGQCCYKPTEYLTSAKGISMRAVAIADQEGPFPDRALAELSYSGSFEELTAVLLVQGATAILSDHELRKKIEGGILTPACLGMGFVERLRSAGVEIESTLV